MRNIIIQPTWVTSLVTGGRQNVESEVHTGGTWVPLLHAGRLQGLSVLYLYAASVVKHHGALMAPWAEKE